MRWLDPARWNVEELAASWHAASPFPHLVLDDVLAPAGVDALRDALTTERHFPRRGALYEMMASAERPAHRALRRFEAELGCGPVRAALEAVTGRSTTRASCRSYVYLAGSYLLPHTDLDPTTPRRLAYAYYLSEAGSCQGGELELFACDLDGDEVVATRPEARIEPIANRLALFDVSPGSLHQVREVTAGARASVAGWFYA